MIHPEDAEEFARLIQRYPSVTPSDLAEWADKPLIEAFRAYQSKRFWECMKRAAARVETWPEWKKGQRVNTR